ncbi:MAG: YraN family protein [Spirochaetia bacterium]|jgi:putative endonuclease
MTHATASTRSKGASGEEAAAAYLARQGWNVLERNFRSPFGEIDIIARRGDEVAFVEVKTWSSLPRGELEHSINRKKRARISRAARLFLCDRKDLAELHARFDVLFLSGPEGDIAHIKNAFGGEGID